MYRELIDGKVRCRDCKDWFLPQDFQHHVGKDGVRRPGSYCKGCKRIRGKRDAAKLRYGLSAEEFQALVGAYPTCAICKSEQVFIDHDHVTGKVRGRLCRSCNTGLGMFRERLDFLDSAKRYLTTFSPNGTMGT